MKQDKIDKKIREITDKKVMEFLKLNPSTTKSESFYKSMNQAKVGMTFVRDREMMRRITGGQNIRVFNLISSNKVELKKYLQKSMPELL